MDVVRRFIVLPVLLYIYINYGMNDLEQHVWAIYAMPLITVAFVVYLAIKNTPKET
jgi:hypothetical protein